MNCEKDNIAIKTEKLTERAIDTCQYSNEIKNIQYLDQHWKEYRETGFIWQD